MYAQAGAGALAMTGTPEARALAAGQLVRQATRGDLDAFEELVRRFQRRVYGFAYQHLRDFDEAYDLTQEIFVKLYRNLARYDAARPFEPWFWKLAANTTINYRRRRVPTPTDRTADPARAGCLAALPDEGAPLTSSTGILDRVGDELDHAGARDLATRMGVAGPGGDSRRFHPLVPLGARRPHRPGIRRLERPPGPRVL